MSEKEALRSSNDYLETKEKLQKLFPDLGRKPVVTTSPMIYAYLPGGSDLFSRNSKHFLSKWQEAEDVSDILQGLKRDINYNNKKLESMSKMLAYLGLVESLGVTLMDIVLLMFVANGIEIHTRGPYAKHVKSFEELRDIDLGYKLEFLGNEGLGMFRRFINQETRNIIAHLKFRIENDGTVTTLKGEPVHINVDIDRFWSGVQILKLVFEDIGFLKWLRNESTTP